MKEQAKSAYDYSGDAAKVVLDVLLSALPIALLYGLIMLLLATVLIVLAHKRKLYTRQMRAWNLLTKLHYPVWLGAFAVFGFALGMIGSFQSSADRAIDDRLQPALVEMAAPLQQQIIDALPPELADGPMTGEAIYDHVVEKMALESLVKEGEVRKDGLFDELGRKLEYTVRSYMVKVVIEKAIASSGVGEKGAKFSIETFKSIDFSKRADEIASKVTGMIKQQVSAFANGLRIQVATFCGLLLLLLLVEPLIYYTLWLPRLRKRAVAPGQPLP